MAWGGAYQKRVLNSGRVCCLSEKRVLNYWRGGGGWQFIGKRLVNYGRVWRLSEKRVLNYGRGWHLLEKGVLNSGRG